MSKLIMLLGNGVTMDLFSHLDIDFERFKINGVSHFYALFALAYTCIQLKANTIAISDKLNSFFASLRSSDAYSEEVSEYKESMQANTRSKGQRVRRIHALTKYCGLND